MSISYPEREFRWGKWHGRHERTGYAVVGFVHQCGADDVRSWPADLEGHS